jgi:putative membrane-bound dehydrogenase-like protein
VSDNIKSTTRNILAGFFVLLLVSSSCTREKRPAEPLARSAAQSLLTMKLSEDFKVELFLSEPQVMSPVEMVFDENGRIYVAEMLDYPDDPPPGTPARSRIRMLEDGDGDGKYEKVTVYADHVLQVSGILPWKGGLLVTSAPDILWMKDEDNDGRADLRKVLFTGFGKVNPENRITNLRYGLDNWIYAAQHGNDGRITSPDHPEHPPVLIRGADFRFHPVTGEFEAASGPAQFGSTFDDWGNQFITQNTIHVRHVVLPMKYIARAPLLNVPAYATDISDHGRPSARMFALTGPQAWRMERTRLRQQRYQEQGLNRTEHVAGYFTAASGGTVYNGDVFPAEYSGRLFTGDVSGNLVHLDVLKPDGVTFSASRSKDETEFLASTDVWFRPCNFANAPDGNLYLMDIYRLFIETPESIPEEIKKGMDFYAGDKLGRIYRLIPNNPRRQRSLKPQLGTMGVAELVKQLEENNGWHRQTAQRLLVERQEKSAVPLLRELAQQSGLPLARLLALATLEGLSSLDEQVLLRALKDPHPRVREHAVRLSEPFLAKSQSISNSVLSKVSDEDLRVQFQLAFTLGELRDKRTLKALSELAVRHAGDKWFRLAILSSVNEEASSFFHLLRTSHAKFENEELFKELASLIGTRHDPAELSHFLRAVMTVNQPEPILRSLERALQLAGVKGLRVEGAAASLRKFLESPVVPLQDAAWETASHFAIPGLVEKAMGDALRDDLMERPRVLAIRALRGGQFTVVEPILRKLLETNETPEIQIAAVETLSSFDHESIGASLLSSWRRFSPSARPKVLEALLSERKRMELLLAAVEANQVERTALNDSARARLLNHSVNEIAERARKLFRPDAGDRETVIAGYKESLQLKGSETQGKQFFENHCAKCHLPQRGSTGRVGPDLSGISNKTKEELLTSILNPSYAIESRFVNYIVTSKEGRVYEGILANETPGTITLRGGDGELTILRRNVAEIRTSNISLMPDGFERGINQQAMADLIAYLRGGL